ncbi:YhcN/YlaJ family sporulation lipoprotein [Paenibacillus odorifer]|uniref:YhcN/YlaJ family sporulation lipoprotein n=1 Tax=Paenibacillus odorifer TaxID=189426 RepID=UPI0020BF3E3A|nr:YhcN/YlaJ family sporulation lipoprotein [Paenibacillus odorifer]
MLRSKISMSVSAALLLGLVSITGCGTNTAEKSNVQTNSVRGVNDGRIGVNSVRGGTHNITKMEVSQELADRIAAMPEVRSANVMLAGKSAYVAVTLNDATAGLRAKGTPSYRAKSSTTPHNYGPTGVMSGTGRVKIGRDGMNDTGAVTNGMNGALKGTVNTIPGTTSTGPATRNGINGMGNLGAGMLGTGTGTGTGTMGTGTTRNHTYNNGPLLNSNGSKHDVDMGMGKGMGTGMGMGMRSTTPSTHDANYRSNSTHMYNTNSTNNTINTRETETVTKAIKDKIAAEVKKHDARIKDVYVSANPDFVERANVYAEEARAGHPIKGFVDEFRTMVERIFPTRNY